MQGEDEGESSESFSSAHTETSPANSSQSDSSEAASFTEAIECARFQPRDFDVPAIANVPAECTPIFSEPVHSEGACFARACYRCV